MGNKPKHRCLLCAKEFKKKSCDSQVCPSCGSGTTAPLARIDRKRKHAGQLAAAGGDCKHASPPSKRAGLCEAVDGTRQGAAEALRSLVGRATLLEAAGPSLYAALRDIAAAETIAVDCEGIRLSRTGALTLIQIATASRYYLFDVQALGAQAFTLASDGEASLKSMLEDGLKRKLMFDCRVDSDALFHQFGVSLQGVFDLQLLAVSLMRHLGKKADMLPGYARQWLGTKTVGIMSVLKERIHAQLTAGEGESDLWGKRPLQPDTIRYAAAGVAIQMPLYRAMMERIQDETVKKQLVERVQAVSALRVREYRDLAQAHTQGGDSKQACRAPDGL